ncbi:3-hydroxybutyryl-CoA dehydrogenase [Alkalihalobacillus alcalophilus ATCC 27647 = CGMCC 1.3604]|uniref:3-hydroxybutyryl-CoA dehydrogenase n=1 Tax=Alkalihalobacillus alcalophilus ATCC 27647 = CGMCC 1.3604 TaxID=1218173 RepID=A0A094YQC7_ALKAL|nr:3-hydroxyacyl-CoA dehydrogenase NAD-binding domain-containing protein [Alkalihalobacillus alcalophilus]KGA95672.1 3-hydroxybutyryl-CoA dehydrogenase [Alkalihalobacillus alcalophilus ATCC 27647 = CGMCC 1.3604]MED1563754.1 3-hydroxyacyl-CoA dehydrogenase NAD-binding domain-containing protein [Alkalihalobacillus alcalophilus]THG92271.1 3-hydroxybutyryl-CoA dehydrogenase [Alkalihalobacillus alcalophilus ATCC 27647 = CGMCC 1.3604]
MVQMKKVGVVGSGTMGTGIVQLAIQNGYKTVMFDISNQAAQRAKEQLEKILARLVEKGKLTKADQAEALACLQATTEMDLLKDCDLIIEAASEKLEVKQAIFKQLEAICHDKTILATNTSSLSITEIAGALKQPEKVAGLHFFNPAPLMPLVEVVSGINTNEQTVEQLFAWANSLKKTAVLCKDTPGFIVNRVARPFYNEALRIMNDGVASVEQIDRIMKKAGHFKMGPFELQDLIGIDINLATTKTVHQNYYGESRFRPHYYQERLVQAGRLGRKTKGGFYTYE